MRPNTTFNLSAIIFYANGDKLSTPIQQIKTLHSYYKPENIRHLNVKRVFREKTASVDVTISWEPGFGNFINIIVWFEEFFIKINFLDKTCFYDVVYHSSENGNFPLQSIPIRDVRFFGWSVFWYFIKKIFYFSLPFCMNMKLRIWWVITSILWEFGP